MIDISVELFLHAQIVVPFRYSGRPVILHQQILEIMVDAVDAVDVIDTS